MFDAKSAWNTVSSAVGSALGSLNPENKGENSLSASYQSKISQSLGGPKAWSINSQDWYRLKPFEFSVHVPKRPGNSVDALANERQYSELYSYNFVLPIPPQTLVIRPVSASNVTATMGGVVEEVSPIKFWTISMSGTTGTAVGRTEGDESSRRKMASKFRSILSTSGIFDGVIGPLQQSFGKIATFINQGADAFDAFSQGSDGLAAGFGAAAGAVNTALTPPLPYSSSSVDGDSNGFLEAQELQKFFYMYDYLKAYEPKSHMLRFTNYKTNQSWRCQVKDFALQQSASNPYLFRYTINLQCWDVMPADALSESKVEAFDRFGPDGDLAAVNTATSALASEALDKIF